MCGLAGTYRLERDVDAMLDAVAHRGPDGRGVGTLGAATHGHVRLAVLDPQARSDQPFRYRGGLLSYNGELWNHHQLRDRLAGLGHRFHTDGDTEVLAAALTQWGVEQTLERLDGMFCFAWSTADVDVLVRDRLGKLPLYAVRHRDGYAWSSERKGLLEDRGAGEAIPGAHLLDLRTGQLRRYYQVPRLPAPAPETLEEYLSAGVRRRLLTADVPVCVLLSGGLDSSLIAALAVRDRPDLVAYTCYVTPDSPDLHAARDVAKHLGVELREVQVPEPTDDDVRHAVHVVEVPQPTAVEIATLCLPLAARVAADGFKVALCGEAADELFGGYGNLARHAGTDEEWRGARLAAFEKMGRVNFQRVNKAFMAHGVEGRLPFCELPLVQTVLSLGVADCPPAKRALRAVGERHLPRELARRPKAAFQTAAGVPELLAARYPSRTRYYNSLIRAEFGRLVGG